MYAPFLSSCGLGLDFASALGLDFASASGFRLRVDPSSYQLYTRTLFDKFLPFNFFLTKALEDDFLFRSDAIRIQ